MNKKRKATYFLLEAFPGQLAGWFLDSLTNTVAKI